MVETLFFHTLVLYFMYEFDSREKRVKQYKRILETQKGYFETLSGQNFIYFVDDHRNGKNLTEIGQLFDAKPNSV